MNSTISLRGSGSANQRLLYFPPQVSSFHTTLVEEGVSVELIHLLIFIITNEHVVGFSEGTPYITSHFSDYIHVLRLFGKLEKCNIEDTLSKFRIVENKLFEKVYS